MIDIELDDFSSKHINSAIQPLEQKLCPVVDADSRWVSMLPNIDLKNLVKAISI